jgi:NAD+ synthase (glutamine-hydrolysing)
MKIAICQINPVVGDFAHNTSLVKEACERARVSACVLAVFPELSLLGYPPKDLLEKPAFIAENLKVLDGLASEIEGISVLCGFVDRNPNKTGKSLINSAALLSGGRVVKKGGKRLLPTYDVFDEARYFEPAQESLVFEMEGLRFGVTICEDIWNVSDFEGVPRYAVDPLGDLETRGIQVLINISASPFTIKKRVVRQAILQRLSVRYHIPIIFCNQVGGNDDILFDGSSMVVDSTGKLILLGREFESDLLVWDSQKDYPVTSPPFPGEESSILKGLAMGTRDYARKCGFTKVLLGLSGGIDSALVAVIAQRAMGAENVMAVGMPSPFTSEMSRQDARRLTENLDISFSEIPITDVFESHKAVLQESFKGLEEDVTEENIQARIRGTLLMALSNKFNALLLTTGNKSELAMGYCTLYGDMNGGLAVISDVPKTMCYELARYINRENEIIPERIITRPPSAELKPDQADQDSLPPYEILDDILEAALVRNLGFQDIVAMGHDPDTVGDVLRRVAINEYKRRQAPPGLKITTKAFGYGRRYPIARGRQVY